MSAQPPARLTPEQYLEIDRAAQTRSEFYDGIMYAMSGGTLVHALVTTNLCTELQNALRGRCLVTASNLRIRVDASGLYTYPDVAVICGKPQHPDNRKDTLLNPAILIEVLSPSTEAYDRGFKATQFRQIESLEEYALVSQNEPRVEIFRRQTGGHWLFTEFAGLDATCRFDSVEAGIPMSEIYLNVVFGEEPGPPDWPSTPTAGK